LKIKGLFSFYSYATKTTCSHFFLSVSILTLLIRDPRYWQNSLRQQLGRVRHAHAGVLLVLSLLALLNIDQTDLLETWKQGVCSAMPSSAIFLPTAFFLSVFSPAVTKPNALIYLADVGAAVLANGLIMLGVRLC
jgi:hypothetical protein